MIFSIRVAVTILACIISITAFSQHTPVLLPADLQAANGKWSGILTYLDYSSNKPVSIPATLLISGKDSSCFVWEYDYPKEPGHGSKTEYCIRNGGQYFNERKLVQKTKEEGGLTIVLEEAGTDGNDAKPVVFQHIISMSANQLILTKMIKREGEAVFTRRNQYVFSR